METKYSKTALITGASSGIGAEFARIFAKKGYHLVLVSKSMKSATELLQELPGADPYVIERDLTETSAPKDVYDELKERGIKVDVLVNNAGFGDFGLFHELKLERQIQMIDLNVRALTELTYLFGKDMVARRSGKILNVASTASFQPVPLFSVYAATKHYVLAFSEGIANEWKSFGVTVTALCPGPTKTNFFKVAAAEKGKLSKQKRAGAHDVALFGYKAMQKGKTVVVFGAKNSFLVQVTRFVPRNLVTKIARAMQ
jgi:hypothetical protein